MKRFFILTTFLTILAGCQSVDSNVTDISPEVHGRESLKPIEFVVKDTSATKGPTPITSLPQFNVSATSGSAGSEASALSNLVFESKNGVFKSDAVWPSSDPKYHFYASNVAMTHTASGQTVTISSIDKDVVCAYLASPTYKVKNALTFNHILARVGTVTFLNLDLCSDVKLSMKYSGSGTYNIRTGTWSGVGGQSTKELTTADNDFWIIPGTYEVTINYKDGNGASQQKRVSYAFNAGKVNNIVATLGDDVVVKIDDPVVNLSYSPTTLPCAGDNYEPLFSNPTISYSQTVHYASGRTTVITEGGEISYSFSASGFNGAGNGISINKNGLLIVNNNGDISPRKIVVVATVVLNGKTGQGEATITQQAGMEIIEAFAPEFSISYEPFKLTEEGGTVFPYLSYIKQRVHVKVDLGGGRFKETYEYIQKNDIYGRPGPALIEQWRVWLAEYGGTLSFEPVGEREGFSIDHNGTVSASYNSTTAPITYPVDVTVTMNGKSATVRVTLYQDYSNDPILDKGEPYISKFIYDPSVIGANGGTASPVIECAREVTHSKSGKRIEPYRNFTIDFFTGTASGFTLSSNGKVEAQFNSTGSERSIEVTVYVTIEGKQYSKTCSVLQNNKNDYSISVNPTTLIFENGEVDFAKRVDVNCPVGDWEVASTSYPWTAIEYDTSFYVYTYSSNDSETANTGYAVVRCKSDRTKTATVNLIHKGKTGEDLPVIYSISVNPTGLTFDSDAAGSGSKKTATVTCPNGSWEILSKSTGWTAMKNGNSIEIYPDAVNTSTVTAKTGSVTVRCTGDHSKTAIIDLTQNKKSGGGGDTPVSYSISVNPPELTFGSDAAGSGSKRTATVTCPNGGWEIEPYSTTSGWTATKNGNSIEVYPDAANTSTTTAKTGSVTVRCTGDYSKTATISLIQDKKIGGDTPVTYSISVNPTELTFDSDAAGSGFKKTVTVTCPYGSWEIETTSPGWTATKNGNSIEVYPDAANTSTTTAKTGSVTVRCTGDYSKKATVNLTQNKRTNDEPDPDQYDIDID